MENLRSNVENPMSSIDHVHRINGGHVLYPLLALADTTEFICP